MNVSCVKDLLAFICKGKVVDMNVLFYLPPRRSGKLHVFAIH